MTEPLKLEERLLKKLKRSHVRVDAPDGDTVFLRNVPPSGGCFNKSHTNLLIKRARTGLPFLICVDEDLEYTGADRSLRRAFTAAHKQQGWRVLCMEQDARADLQRVVERALDLLGFDRREPVLDEQQDAPEKGAARDGLLSSFGTDISEMSAAGAEPTVGREAEVNAVISALLQWQTKLGVLVGRSGVGKTNLLYEVARRLRASRPEMRLVSVDLADLFAGTMFDAERENLFLSLLNEAAGAPRSIVAMEHLEAALVGQVPRANVHLANALDRGAKLFGTVVSSTLTTPRLPVRRARVVELEEMSPGVAEEVLRVLRERIASHHGVGVDARLVPALVATARPLEGLFPAKAIALLDAAAAEVALSGRTQLCEQDIRLAALGFSEDEEYPTLIAADG